SSFINHHGQENSSPSDSIAVNPISAAIYDTLPTIANSNTSSSKSTNRWTPSETRMLIHEVGKHQGMLQHVKDPREKGRIWNVIVSNVQTCDVAGPVLRERTKNFNSTKMGCAYAKISRH
ncbi:26057_t:CDS:1, partial [Gigaspora rosea]